MTPKNVLITIMYRDAANYKNTDSRVYTNTNGISEDTIFKFLDELMDKEIIPHYYGLFTMAPSDNEFIPIHNEMDHPYCELTGFEFIEKKDGYAVEGDISDVVNRTEKLVYELINNDLLAAVEIIAEDLSEILSNCKNKDLYEKLTSRTFEILSGDGHRPPPDPAESISHYLSNDGNEIDEIIAFLRESDSDIDDEMADRFEYAPEKKISVWEPLTHKLTIGDLKNWL